MVEELYPRQRGTDEQLVLSNTEGVISKGYLIVANIDSGDEERKACASNDQTVKISLVKKKDFSCQGPSGRGVVYYDVTMKDKSALKMNREVLEDEDAPIDTEVFITDVTTGEDAYPFWPGNTQGLYA